MLDASVLIEYFRRKDKNRTLFSQVVREYDIQSISVVAKLEVLYGARAEFVEYWDAVFVTLDAIPLTDEMVAKAHRIVLELKRKNRLIAMEDIMIAATAMVQKIPLATLNRRHFERIEGLILVDGERTLP